HRQVGQVRQAVVLPVDGGELEVARAERGLVRQRVHILGDVHQRVLVAERRHVDVVQPDHVGYRTSPDGGGKLAGVIVGRGEVEYHLKVLVRRVERRNQCLRRTVGRLAGPEMNRACGVDTERLRRWRGV